jgi:hypothetical protein
MLNKIAIVAGLMTVITLAQGSIARADNVRDAINGLDSVTDDIQENYNRQLPKIQELEERLKQLNYLCYYQGNNQACLESTEIYRRLNRGGN